MVITPLTANDKRLADVATEIADRLFPDLPDGYRIGAFEHLPVLESRRLFLGSGDFFEIGRISRLAVPGAAPLLLARVWEDYSQAIRGHGVSCNILGSCATEEKYVLVDEKLDPATDTARAVVCHEFCHGAAPSFPPHSALWRDRMRHAAEDARRLDMDEIGFLLDSGHTPTGWKGYRPSPDAPADCEVAAVYLDHVCGQWTAAAQRHRIVLSDGISLRA